jgi:hypothetical protein
MKTYVLHMYDSNSLNFLNEMFQRKFVNKHFLLISFFYNCAVYETIWKILIQPEWPQMTV